MATVGQPLTAPEAGWRRIEQSDTNITYEGIWTLDCPHLGASGGSISYATGNREIRFNFIGTKIRYIGRVWDTYYSKVIDVYIDNVKVGTFSQNTGTRINQILNFEYTGLSLGEHQVRVSTAANGIALDAIEIDSDGILKPYNTAPANLIATAGDSNVSLSWDAFSDVTSYNVKRSTTVGGPYETIAPNVQGTSYVDTAVTNGTTYYYVVTAITANGESANSNEASATPKAEVTPPTGDKLLRVTVIDSSERDYQIPTADIDAFVNWFMKHTSADTAGYMLPKKVGTQNSKEYLAFDKIISFEVMELK